MLCSFFWVILQKKEQNILAYEYLLTYFLHRAESFLRS